MRFLTPKRRQYPISRCQQQHQENDRFHQSPSARSCWKPTLLMAISGVYFLVQVFSKNYMENSFSLSSTLQEESDKAITFSVASTDQSRQAFPLANSMDTTATHITADMSATDPPRDDVTVSASIYPLVDSMTSTGNHHHVVNAKLSTSCSRERIRNGHWKDVPRKTMRYVLPEKAWENVCRRKENSSIPDHWEWVVDGEEGCSFDSFDVDTFCRFNQNRSIAFLGDSIAWQQFNALSYWIGAIDVHRETLRIETIACNNSTKLVWLRDNSASSKATSKILTSDPDVIVMNRGAHYVENPILELELNATFSTVSKWQQDCDRRGKDCLLIWRTTAPGFPDCDNAPGPIRIEDKPNAEALISNSSHPWYADRQKFHWWNFKYQNAFVENLLEAFVKEQGLRISFVDFYEMAILRPDLHIGNGDCLHYCLPGPFDAVNAVLLHEIIKHIRSTR